jgi:signal transduction histidine kinase
MNMQLQYEENRKELISNISHDLKTPITAIKGYVEGIKDGIADTPEKMDRYINTIYSKSCDMDNLINELFLFSKLDLKKVNFDFRSIDITAYLKDCIEELKFDLEKRKINLNYNHIKKNIDVIADAQKLKRVIMNIIENSIKYMNKDNGKIDIILSEEEAFTVIEVRDNGKGISNKALPFIFDRFYRGDSYRNTSNGGSGLGLAIAKQIIEEHGGQIWVQSEVNEGTSIFFTLKKV